jgi:hypothetical protein
MEEQEGDKEKRRNLILEIPPISKSQVASMKKGDCDGGIEVVAGPLSTPTLPDSGCGVKLFFQKNAPPFPIHLHLRRRVGIMMRMPRWKPESRGFPTNTEH